MAGIKISRETRHEDYGIGTVCFGKGAWGAEDAQGAQWQGAAGHVYPEKGIHGEWEAIIKEEGIYSLVCAGHSLRKNVQADKVLRTLLQINLKFKDYELAIQAASNAGLDEISETD